MAKERGKFDGVTFSSQNVEQWFDHHTVSAAGFRCLRPEFNTFWKKGRIQRELRSHLSRCWTLQHDGNLAAYITLLADKLTVEEQLLLHEEVKYRTFPAVKVGLLAADRRARGAERCLMDWALSYVARSISVSLGVRFVTVDALCDPDTGYDSSGFYAAIGFRFANPDEPLPPVSEYRTMYFDLKPLIDALSPS
jgi:predicted GNAT superfamily acetyltransferase